MFAVEYFLKISNHKHMKFFGNGNMQSKLN